MRKILSLVCAILLLAAVFVGCTRASEPASQSTSVTVTDLAGKSVTVNSVPEKIVSLSPSTTEILYALGLGEKIVGRDASSDYPEAASSVAVMGDYNGPNIEAIAASAPDLILTAANTLQEEAVAKFEELGIPTAAVEAGTYDEIAASITLIGKLTGTEKEAEELNASMKKDAEAIAQAVDGLETPTVYYVMSYGEWGNWTSGPGSFINTIIEMAGGKPITADAEYSWLEYSLEQLLADDPDVIFVSSDLGDPALLAEAEGYCDLRCVKEGYVYELDASTSTRPGPRILEACRYIVNKLHPADE